MSIKVNVLNKPTPPKSPEDRRARFVTVIRILMPHADVNEKHVLIKAMETLNSGDIGSAEQIIAEYLKTYPNNVATLKL